MTLISLIFNIQLSTWLCSFIFTLSPSCYFFPSLSHAHCSIQPRRNKRSYKSFCKIISSFFYPYRSAIVKLRVINLLKQHSNCYVLFAFAIDNSVFFPTYTIYFFRLVIAVGILMEMKSVFCVSGRESLTLFKRISGLKILIGTDGQ
jgi:hypothetical protein